LGNPYRISENEFKILDIFPPIKIKKSWRKFGVYCLDENIIPPQANALFLYKRQPKTGLYDYARYCALSKNLLKNKSFKKQLKELSTEI
jgi:hypothetical protein